MVQPLWKTVWRLLTKLGAKLPYDPARASWVVQLIKTLFASAGDYPWLRTTNCTLKELNYCLEESQACKYVTLKQHDNCFNESICIIVRTYG